MFSFPDDGGAVHEHLVDTLDVGERMLERRAVCERPASGLDDCLAATWSFERKEEKT